MNGINGRLPVLVRWLELAEPDIVCLQELKAPQEWFPEKAIRDAGYEAVRHGQSRWNGVAILSRVGEIYETRRGLPGNPDDVQSRYIEAAINGVLVAGLYLPNGNPRPGPNFAFKLRWCTNAGVAPTSRHRARLADSSRLCALVRGGRSWLSTGAGLAFAFCVLQICEVIAVEITNEECRSG